MEFRSGLDCVPCQCSFVDSGEIVSRKGSLSNSGRVTLRKVFHRSPRVFAGPSCVGPRGAVGLNAKFAVTKQTTTRRRFDWESHKTSNNAAVRGNWALLDALCLCNASCVCICSGDSMYYPRVFNSSGVVSK